MKNFILNEGYDKNSILFERDLGRTCCFKVKSMENNINSAYFELIPNWFNSI